MPLTLIAYFAQGVGIARATHRPSTSFSWSSSANPWRRISSRCLMNAGICMIVLAVRRGRPARCNSETNCGSGYSRRYRFAECGGMNHVAVTDSGGQAHGLGALEDVQIHDVVAGQGAEIHCLIEAVAEALQIRACSQHRAAGFVARESDEAGAEPIGARARIALQELLLDQHLEVAVQGALRHPGRGYQLLQRCAATRRAGDLSQDHAGSANRTRSGY